MIEFTPGAQKGCSKYSSPRDAWNIFVFGQRKYLDHLGIPSDPLKITKNVRFRP